jgi:hypothetical protein
MFYIVLRNNKMNFNTLNHKFVAYFQQLKTFIHLFINSKDLYY